MMSNAELRAMLDKLARSQAEELRAIKADPKRYLTHIFPWHDYDEVSGTMVKRPPADKGADRPMHTYTETRQELYDNKIKDKWRIYDSQQ